MTILDCNQPYGGLPNFPPDSCNYLPVVVDAIEIIVNTICDGLSFEEREVGVVPEGTPDADFNTFFPGGTPDIDAVVFEGNNIWVTNNSGATWTLIQPCQITIDSFLNITALATGNSLEPGCVYWINNPTNTGFTYYAFVAIDESEIPASGFGFNTALGEWIFATYDVVGNTITGVIDGKYGNLVFGSAAVNAFPFGVSTIANNFINNPGTFTLTGAGTFSNNIIIGGSFSCTLNTGTINRNSFTGGTTNITNNSGTLRDNIFVANTFTLTNNAGTWIGNELYDQTISFGTGFTAGSVFRDNIIKGSTLSQVSGIIGASANIRSNRIFQTTFALGAFNGNFVGNLISNCTSVDISSSSGNINYNEIVESSANLTSSTGTFEHNTLRDNAGTPNFSTNAGTISNNRFISCASISSTNNTLTGLIKYNEYVDSTITHLNNSLNIQRNMVRNSTITCSTNSGSISGNWFFNNSTVTFGTNSGNFSNNKFSNTTISGGQNITGNSGSFTYNTFEQANAGCNFPNNAGNISHNTVRVSVLVASAIDVDSEVTSNIIEGNSTLTVATATNCDITRNTLKDFSTLTASAMNGSNVNNINLSGSSTATFTGSTTGTYSVNFISGTSSINFTNGNTCTVRNCFVDGQSSILGTGYNNNTVAGVKVFSNSSLDVQNSDTNVSGLVVENTSSALLASSSGTVLKGHIFDNSTLTGNAAGFTGTIENFTISGNGGITITTCAGSVTNNRVYQAVLTANKNLGFTQNNGIYASTTAYAAPAAANENNIRSND